MVAGEKDFRDFPILERFWTSVVGMIKRTGGERFLDGRFVISKNTRDQPHNGICEDESGQDATRENIVANGNLLIHEVVAHALIYAFVVPAQKDEMRLVA